MASCQLDALCCGALPRLQQILRDTVSEESSCHKLQHVYNAVRRCKRETCTAIQIEYTKILLDLLQDAPGEALTKSATLLLNSIFLRRLTDVKSGSATEYVEKNRQVLLRAVKLIVDTNLSNSRNRCIQRNTLAQAVNLSSWPSLGAGFIACGGCSIVHRIFNRKDDHIVAADYEWYEYALCLTNNLACKNGVMLTKAYEGGSAAVVHNVLHSINYFSSRDKILKIGLQALINLAKLDGEAKVLILDSCVLNGIMQAHSEDQEVLASCIKIVANCLFVSGQEAESLPTQTKLKEIVTDSGLLKLIKLAVWEFDLNAVISHLGSRIISLESN